MGKQSNLLLWLAALVFASGAVWVANHWLESRLPTQEARRDDGEMVVAAVTDIAFGQRIEAAQLRQLRLPPGTLPRNALRTLEEAQGQVARQAIYAGEVLIADRLVAAGGGSALAAVITPGMRAVTVRVDDVIGVAGFLLPGNRVDVIASKGGRGQVSSRTLLQDVKVLAVDQTAATDKNQPVIVRAVTLELPPELGEKLVQATKEGAVQLALRNPQEQSPRTLVEEPKPEPRPRLAQAPRPPAVTLIRGTQVDRVTLLR